MLVETQAVAEKADASVTGRETVVVVMVVSEILLVSLMKVDGTESEDPREVADAAGRSEET